jgi:hypothetical protein
VPHGSALGKRIVGVATTSHAAARYSRTVANRNKRERGTMPMRLLNADR